MATILTDNFDSYDNGDLNGQGSWSGSTNYDVEGTVYVGTKAVQIAPGGGDVSIEKIGTQLAAGAIKIQMRCSNADSNGPVFYIKEGATNVAHISFIGPTDIRGYGNPSIVIGSWSVNTWYTISIQWATDPDKLVRFKVDDGAWSDWVEPQAEWTTGPDRVMLYASTNTGTQYWDEIEEAIVSSNYTMDVTVGNYTITGINVGLLRPIINMAVEVGTYTITGVNVTLQKAINMAVAVGQYIITGKNILLKFSGWGSQLKSSAVSPSNSTKHSATASNSNRSSSTWSNQAKT